MAGKFYAVRQGRVTGIFNNWDDCKAQVEGYSGAQYKSFKTAQEAFEYMGGSWSGSKAAGATKTKAAGATALQPDITKLDENEIIAYVDGSYNATTKEFSYGMVILDGREELKFSKKVDMPQLASMRNVAGEIKGSEAAMQYAFDNGYSKITIYYDYEGIEKWCLGLWKTNKEGTREYKAFYDKISKKVEVNFVKVKGHSNDHYNDMVDELAKQAIGII